MTYDNHWSFPLNVEFSFCFVSKNDYTTLTVENNLDNLSITLSVSEESSIGVIPFSKSEKFGVVEEVIDDAPDSSVWVPSSKNKFPGLLEVSVMIG